MSNFKNQDFSNKNLSGKSFKGLDLTGSNFSQANLRGTDFTKAILRNVNFSETQAGFKKSSIFFFLTIAFILATLVGLTSGCTGYLMTYFFQPRNLVTSAFPPGLAVLILLGIFFYILFQVGIYRAFTILAILLMISIAISFTGALVTLVALFGMTLAVIAFALAFFVAGNLGLLFLLTESVAIAIMLGVIGSKETTKIMAESSNTILLGTELFSILFALALPSLSAYIGWQSILGDNRFNVVQKLVLYLTDFGKGTSFQEADLTDANFNNASLQGVNFRKANLTRTCWSNAKKLELAKIDDDSILSHSDIRELMVTGQGRRSMLVRTNLKGANLAGVDLTQANLSESDLSEANFEGAFLIDANLSKTLVYGTNFKHANLTGICLEGWKVNQHTQFEQIICDYIFLSRYPRKRYPETGQLLPDELLKLLNSN